VPQVRLHIWEEETDSQGDEEAGMRELDSTDTGRQPAGAAYTNAAFAVIASNSPGQSSCSSLSGNSSRVKQDWPCTTTAVSSTSTDLVPLHSVLAASQSHDESCSDTEIEVVNPRISSSNSSSVYVLPRETTPARARHPPATTALLVSSAWSDRQQQASTSVCA